MNPRTTRLQLSLFSGRHNQCGNNRIRSISQMRKQDVTNIEMEINCPVLANACKISTEDYISYAHKLAHKPSPLPTTK